MAKIKLGVFFGGPSPEHDVSVESARWIISNLDKNKYDIVPVGVDKSGHFYFGKSAILSNMPAASQMLIGCSDNLSAASADISPKSCEKFFEMIDVAFPIIHGTFGEDGAIQGLFRSFNIPFVGPSVLGAAITIDKDVTKRLLRDAGIVTAKYLVFPSNEFSNIKYNEVTKILGDVVFIKPAKLGSSIGVSKVASEDHFKKAVELAFSYDDKIIVEEFINGREIECSVLGNEVPEASLPGEILINQEFYSYSAKYIDGGGAELKFPADLPIKMSDRIRETSIEAFKILCCQGMARVDFFIRDNSEIILNEVNTIPGFTEISMYPKLWEASGISYPELLDKLISLATHSHDREKKRRRDC